MGDQLSTVKGCSKGFDLGEQTVHELLARAHGQAWNVINGFVRVELDTLTARTCKGVHEVTVDAKESKLKDLKKPHRPGTHDENIGVHGGVKFQSHSKLRWWSIEIAAWQHPRVMPMLAGLCLQRARQEGFIDPWAKDA